MPDIEPFIAPQIEAPQMSRYEISTLGRPGEELSGLADTAENAITGFMQQQQKTQQADLANDRTFGAAKSLQDLAHTNSQVSNNATALADFDKGAAQIQADAVKGLDPGTAQIVGRSVNLATLAHRDDVWTSSMRLQNDAGVAKLHDMLDTYSGQYGQATTDIGRAAAANLATSAVAASVHAGYVNEEQGDQLHRQFFQAGDKARADRDVYVDPEAFKTSALNGGYPYLPEGDRSDLLNKADEEIARNQAKAEDAQNKYLAGVQGTVRQAIDDNTASLQTTGKPAVPLDPSAIYAAYPADKYPGVAQGYVDQLDTASKFNIAMTKVATAPDSQLESIYSAWAPHGSGFRDQQQYQDLIGKAIDARTKALNSDPADYVAQNFPSVGQALDAAQKDPTKMPGYVTALDAAYSQLGQNAPYRSTLPKQLAEDLTQQVVSAPSGQRAQTFLNMAQSYGSAWPRVLGDMVSLGKLPTGYEMLTALPDPAARTMLADALADPKALRSQFGEADLSTLNRSIRSDIGMQQLGKSLGYAAGGADKFGDIVNAVGLIGQRYMAEGLSPEVAAAKAAASVTTDKYDFLADGARVPKGMGSEVETAADNYLASLKPSDLAPLDNPKGIAYSPNEIGAATLQQAQAGRWVTNEQDNGLFLISATGRPVLDRKGNRIGFTFAHLPQSPPAPDAATPYEAGAGN